MTDYHLGPLFRFIPNALLYKLGLMKLGDSITDTIEAVIESNLSTSPVTTTDVFAAHNRQNNWWYTGDGDLIVWTDQQNAYNSPMLYYKEHKILDFSDGTILCASAHGNHFYYVADYFDGGDHTLIVSYVDLSDTATVTEFGAYSNAIDICWLSRATGSLSSIDLSEIFIDTLSGTLLRFLTPAFNADCTQLNIGIGSDLHMLSGVSGQPAFGEPASCATVTFAGPVTTLFSPFTWDGGYESYNDQTVLGITQTPRPASYTPNISFIFHAYRHRNTHYDIGDKVHGGENLTDAELSGNTPHYWTCSVAGTTAPGGSGTWIPGVDKTDGGVTWTYTGVEYLPFDPEQGVTAVQHASNEAINPAGSGAPTEYGTLESLVSAKLATSTGDAPTSTESHFTYVHSVSSGPTSFASNYYSSIKTDHNYSPIPGINMTGVDPAFYRMASIATESYHWVYDEGVLVSYVKETLAGKYTWLEGESEEFTAGDFATYSTRRSVRTMFTYSGSNAISGSFAPNDGDEGYHGAIPVGWVLDRADNIVKQIDIRQVQPKTLSGSAVGETGISGFYNFSAGLPSNPIAGSFMVPDALAEYSDGLSVGGSYDLTETIVSPHLSGVYIGGVLQATMAYLTKQSFGPFSKNFYTHYVGHDTGERTYATQTALSPTTLTNTSDSSLNYKTFGQEILGWNFAGKAFYVERWESAAVLDETSSVETINHTASYLTNGATVFSRSFAWGEDVSVAPVFSLRDVSGFAYCYTQPITIGSDILFSTCHSFSDPGGVPSVFGIGSTANADQFNWLVASDGSIVPSVNLDSGTITINAALNNDVTRQHIALGYTWGL